MRCIYTTYTVISLLFASQASYAGSDSLSSSGNKYKLYASWGYNKGWFSKSDIRFYDPVNNRYDFVLENVKAKDRPSFRQIFRTDISIPQYVYRVGFYNNKKKLGLEINFDHAKYVMINDQSVHAKGRINNESLNKDTILYEDFVKFEHTNGANYLMVNAIKHINLVQPKKQRALVLTFKPGIGICIPKTETWLFGENRDAPFHIAGYILGIEAGPRYEFLRHFFLEATAKGAFVNFYDVLTVQDGRAKHHYFTAEAILTAGFLFHF